jgi:hypothetical protein
MTPIISHATMMIENKSVKQLNMQQQNLQEI